MRKICFCILAASMILLMVSDSFAQSPRESVSSEGKTAFTNLTVSGLNVTGVPGYIEMTNGLGVVFYVWVGSDSRLRIASAPAVGDNASPNTVSWEDGSGPVVGP